jgi:hypothetical protein
MISGSARSMENTSTHGFYVQDCTGVMRALFHVAEYFTLFMPPQVRNFPLALPVRHNVPGAGSAGFSPCLHAWGLDSVRGYALDCYTTDSGHFCLRDQNDCPNLSSKQLDPMVWQF